MMLPPPPPAIVWQQPPTPQTAAGESVLASDDSGKIRCNVIETVTASRSAFDMARIATFVRLVSERNRRYYMAWHAKLPSAAYEVVRRIRPRPYLPYGDMYGITDMRLTLNEDTNRIGVRYLKTPNDTRPELSDDDRVTYETDLRAFIKEIEKEIEKLKKYETSESR